MEDSKDQCCFHNELNLDKACIRCLKADCAKVCDLIANDVCCQEIQTANLNAETAIINNLCVPTKFQASQSWVDSSYNNTLSAQNATLANACITNLNVSNINYCLQFRAAVTNTTNTLYTLGTPINWNLILDDPNHNVSSSPFGYTVPVSGYYVISFHINSDSLTGIGVISGIPTGLMTLLVNGNPLRSQTAAYLSFADNQACNITSLVLLNAGDVITMNYQVLIFTTAGLTPYPGTIDLQGNGSFPGESGFTIHYLSSLNCTIPVCPAVLPVSITCQPVSTPCEPVCCGDQNISPCDSCS